MTPEQVIELVHQIDSLEKQRADATAAIAALRTRLGAALSQPAAVVVHGSARPEKRTSPLKHLAIRHIQENPRADYSTLVVALYGKSNPDAVKNSRTMIFHMRKAGIVVGEPGSWKVKSLSTHVEDEAHLEAAE